MSKNKPLKFVPIQTLRKTHGQALSDLHGTQRRLIERALGRPLFGRKYHLSLWKGLIEVETLDKALLLFEQRRKTGMVRAEGSYWPLPGRDAD